MKVILISILFIITACNNKKELQECRATLADTYREKDFYKGLTDKYTEQFQKTKRELEGIKEYNTYLSLALYKCQIMSCEEKEAIRNGDK